jgi:hypothetical protein
MCQKIPLSVVHRQAGRVRARQQRLEPLAIEAAGPAHRVWVQESQCESRSTIYPEITS